MPPVVQRSPVQHGRNFRPYLPYGCAAARMASGPVRKGQAAKTTPPDPCISAFRQVQYASTTLHLLRMPTCLSAYGFLQLALLLLHCAGQREVPNVDHSPSTPQARAANIEATVSFLCEAGVPLPETALTGGRGSLL